MSRSDLNFTPRGVVSSTQEVFINKHRVGKDGVTRPIPRYPLFWSHNQSNKNLKEKFGTLLHPIQILNLMNE